MDASEAKSISDICKTTESFLNKTLSVIKAAAHNGKEYADISWEYWWGSDIPWEEVEKELKSLGYHVETHYPDEFYSNSRVSWGRTGEKDKINKKFDDQDNSLIPIVLIWNPIMLFLVIYLSINVYSYSWAIWIVVSLLIVMPYCMIRSNIKKKEFKKNYNIEKTLT